jgi:outer membrane protein assembly factor BamB
VDGTGLYLSGSVRTALLGQCYAGADDAFVRKYDAASGDEIWTREFGTQQPDPIAGLAADSDAVFVAAGLNLAKLVRAPATGSAPRIPARTLSGCPAAPRACC